MRGMAVQAEDAGQSSLLQYVQRHIEKGKLIGQKIDPV